jgi:hypothetical protein
MIRNILTISTVLLIGAVSICQEREAAKQHAAAVAPWVDSQAIAIVRVNFEQFKVGELVRMLARESRMPEANATKLTEQAMKMQASIARSGVTELYFIATFADVGQPYLLFAPDASKINGKALVDALNPLFQERSGTSTGLEFVVRDGKFFAGSKRVMEHLKTMKPSARPELEKAFAAAGDGAVQFLVVPSAEHHRVIEEMIRELPKDLGFLSGKKLAAGLRWAAFSLKLDPKPALCGVVQSQDAESAKVMRSFVLDLVQRLGKEKGPDDRTIAESLGREFNRLVEVLTPDAANDQLLFRAEGDQSLASLSQLYRLQNLTAFEGSRMNRMKQIGLALHNYADVNGSFPPSAASGPPGAPAKQVRPLLSWRVYILPYIEQMPLYQQFRLDEPWDSEHNRKLLTKMPAIFRTGNTEMDAAGKTRILAPIIKNGIFELGGAGTKFSEITDGLSNTIAAVDAAEESAVFWSKPHDLTIDEKNPGKGMFEPIGASCLVLFADGSVRHLKKSTDAKTLLNLFQRNDGVAVQLP